MTAYYNEIDPYAAQWLRNLIAAGHIPPGDVDERSIADVSADDLRGYGQCHFFAGIGGWALALDIAEWPRDRQVWTGSCPCQPFSAAGAGRGFDDERHLWPVWQRLIKECRPSIIFGEQVAGSAVGPWLDLVQDDMEAMDYAFGATAFPAASVGAPHIRDRTYWVGHANDARLEGHARNGGAAGRQGSGRSIAEAGISGWVANGTGEYQRSAGDEARPGIACGQGQTDGLADTNSKQQRQDSQRVGGYVHVPEGWNKDPAAAAGLRSDKRMANTDGRHSSPKGIQRGWEYGQQSENGGSMQADHAGPVNGHWSAADWLGCRDGKWRPVEPGTFPLAHGLPGRVGRLRAYGNAIVPQQAAEFIHAVMEIAP